MKRPRERRSLEMRATSGPPIPAGDRRPARLQLVAGTHEGLGAVGQEEVDARTEPDETDALAPGELVSDPGIEDDPPGQRARDLLERDAASGRNEGDAVLLVLDRGLVREGRVLAAPDVRV